MRTGNSRALFWISVFGGIGGGLGGYAGFTWFILWFYGIKPEALRGRMHIAWPAWIWLILGFVLFAISIGSSIWSLRVNLKARTLAEGQVAKLESDLDRWKRQSDTLVGEHSQKLRDLNAGWEQRTAEYVKHVNQEKNKAIEELNVKHAADLKQSEDEKQRTTTELTEIKAELIKSVANMATCRTKLTIHSATYGAIEGGGVDYPVKDFLNHIAAPNSLAFEIRNSQFKVNGWDYVPHDPKEFKKKRLKLTYSYAGGPSRTIRRREGGWLILPEDPYIEGFPLLRLDVINAWIKLDRFFNEQEKRIVREHDDVTRRGAALLYSATPDQYLTAEYDRSLKSDVVDLYQCLVMYGTGDNQLSQSLRSLGQTVYNASSRDEIKYMMEILWQIAPKITEEDSEKDRVPGREGSKEKL